jgi:hypothetical protein
MLSRLSQSSSVKSPSMFLGKADYRLFKDLLDRIGNRQSSSLCCKFFR